MQHAEKTLKPVADAPQMSATAGHSAAVASIHNSPRVVAQRRQLSSLFGGTLQLQVGSENEAPTQTQAAVQLNGLQAVIDRSPRMLAQRHALDAAFGSAIQRQPDGLEDEELLQARMAPVAQRAEIEDVEELPLQGRFRSDGASTAALQRQAAALDEDELPLQARMVDGISQRTAEDEDEEALLQGRVEDAAVQRMDESAGSGDLSAAAPTATAAPVNETGMPNQLKAGIESLSGMDMSDVRVHRNSDKPAQLNALAYAQGNEIHLGPGQEQHLPHEAWHLVQQRQERVRETVQIAGVGVNDDTVLEAEADSMGTKALASRPVDAGDAAPLAAASQSAARPTAPRQLMPYDEVRVGKYYKVKLGSKDTVLYLKTKRSKALNNGKPLFTFVLDEDTRGAYIDSLDQSFEIDDESLIVEATERPPVFEAAEEGPSSSASAMDSDDEGARSSDTDVDEESVSNEKLWERYRSGWKKGQPAFSEATADNLLDGVKKNIAKLVTDAYGNNRSDEPTDLDTVAAGLL